MGRHDYLIKNLDTNGLHALIVDLRNVFGSFGMIWLCGLVAVLAPIMLAGRRHSRYLDRLEKIYELKDLQEKPLQSNVGQGKVSLRLISRH